MIEEFASRVMATRDITQMTCWKAKKYAEHQALTQLCEALPDLLDAAVACHIGMGGDVPAFQVQTRKVADMREHLAEEIDWMQSVREELSGGDSSIGAAIDTLTACYQKTLYLLRLS